MPGSSFGHLFRITTFGESHGQAVGVVIDGVTPGVDLAEEDIQKALDRRKPGQSDVTSPRKEPDKIHILSGTFEGKTTGTTLFLVLYNRDVRSSDYEAIKDLYRPGHADYTYHKKYGIRDWRGSGRASGRETAARVAAGAVKGIEFGAGFRAADMTGKEHNDQMSPDGFETNNAGGVLGGISTGDEILFRVAVKPPSSISSTQKTVDLQGHEREIRTEGRHDPCICPRIVPVVEAMAGLVLEDHFKRQSALHS